jgi:hypothetical protein
VPPELERVLEEALAIARQRGGVIASLTLAAREPDAIRAHTQAIVERAGISTAGLEVMEEDCTTRVVAVEIRRS